MNINDSYVTIEVLLSSYYIVFFLIQNGLSFVENGF